VSQQTPPRHPGAVRAAGGWVDGSHRGSTQDGPRRLRQRLADRLDQFAGVVPQLASGAALQLRHWYQRGGQQADADCDDARHDRVALRLPGHHLRAVPHGVGHLPGLVADLRRDLPTGIQH
jgi:hypothetical protein